MRTDIQVTIREVYNQDAMAIHIFRDIGTDTEVMYYDPEKARWYWTRYDEMAVNIGPTFLISGQMLRMGFAQQLVNAFAKKGIHAEGVNPPAEAFKAQEKHLEDMRTLIFNRDFMQIQHGNPPQEETYYSEAEAKQMVENAIRHDRESRNADL